MANRDLVSPDTRDLSTVTVGNDSLYPYTYPIVYLVEGLRDVKDPDKRTLSDPED